MKAVAAFEFKVANQKVNKQQNDRNATPDMGTSLRPLVPGVAGKKRTAGHRCEFLSGPKNFPHTVQTSGRVGGWWQAARWGRVLDRQLVLLFLRILCLFCLSTARLSLPQFRNTGGLGGSYWNFFSIFRIDLLLCPVSIQAQREVGSRQLTETVANR